MNEKMDKLKSLIAEVADLQAVSALLGWDQLVKAPEGG